jgi:hypothetical protein
VIDHDRLVRACGAVRTAGWVIYDPVSEVCRQESDVPPAYRPPTRPQAAGIVLFDPISRIQCIPGACHVLAGAMLGNALFSDRFEAAP